MKTNIYDYIIFGGGCASLSLSINLVKNKINKPSFLIIEKREKYMDDRSWCFWETNSNNYKDIIECSWKEWSFSKDINRIYHNPDKYSYHYVRSINFYNKATKLIKKSKNITLKLGETILRTYKKKDTITVKTNKGIYSAKNILDTRPQRSAFLEKPLLFQSFLGYELSIKKKQIIEKMPCIMNDMRTHKKNFIFDYIIPFSNRSILLEITYFSNNIISENTIRTELLNRLKKYNLNNCSIIRKEYGVIPMGFLKKRYRDENYFYAGMVGGAIRASSGYGFLNIQKWAKNCSENIKKYDNLFSHPKEKKVFTYLDKCLIKILSSDISLAPHIFYHFLKKIPLETFIKFMNGNTNYFENIKVVMSMPIKIFLKFFLKTR